MASAPSPARRRRVTGRLLAKEVGAFGVVGASCFLLDVALFQLFYGPLGTGAVTAKLLCTLISMTVAYLGHRHWSFSHRAQPGAGRGYLRFGVVNGLTLLLGLAIVALVRHPLQQESVLVLQAANIASILLGTVIRFLCYRTWVFPARESAEVPTPAPARDPAPVTDRG